MWAASGQHFAALLQRDPNNTEARIHRAKAHYNIVSTLHTCMYAANVSTSVSPII